MIRMALHQSSYDLRAFLRNRQSQFFTLALPIVLYLSLAKTATTEGGISFKIYYLFEMASLGAFSGAFNNNAIRISQERKDGWIRQLRLTPLPANSYVVAKIMATVALTALIVSSCAGVTAQPSPVSATVPTAVVAAVKTVRHLLPRHASRDTPSLTLLAAVKN